MRADFADFGFPCREIVSAPPTPPSTVDLPSPWTYNVSVSLMQEDMR